MIPYIITPYGSISTFIIMAVCGILSFFLILNYKLKRCINRKEEETFIFPKVAYAMIVAYIFAGSADAFFKIRENGKFILQGITFYGGFFGGIIAMYVQISLNDSKTQYSIQEWFDILVQPFISFHFFGRIGCFLAGCCYGKPTDSILGVYFPDNIPAGIFHDNEKCLPTQLFEALSLIIIFLIVQRCRKKFDVYIALYAVARFIIEFFRGDYRGGLFNLLSPAQVISVTIIFIIAIKYMKAKNDERQNPR